MSKNKIQRGEVLDLPVPANTKSGDPVAVGEITGVAVMNRAANNHAPVDTCGVHDLPVHANDGAGDVAIAIGDKLYFDGTTINRDAAAVFYGYAMTAIAAGQIATINVKLK